MAHEYRGGQFEDLLENSAIQPGAVVSYKGKLGVAFPLVANLAPQWLAGEVIIFWSDGDVTTISDDVEITDNDLWGLLRSSIKSTP